MTSISIELQYVRTTGAYIVAHDDFGQERWFDTKKDRVVSIDGDRVVMEVDRKKWERRMATTRAVHSIVTETTPKKTRKCLCCKKEFKAEKNIYICSPCKSDSLWSSGNYMG